MRRRVVITGCGVVTPVGTGTGRFFESLIAGRSGIRPITTFDVSDLPTKFAGEPIDFDPDETIPRKVSRRLDPFAQYALAAAVEAVQSSKLEINEELADRVGVLIGAGYGSAKLTQQYVMSVREKGPEAISAFASATTAIDSAASEVMLRFGARGPSGAVSTACASGTTSIGEAFRWIQCGTSDVVLCGGSDASVTRTDIASACAARALSRRNDAPERASRPFDVDRDGFVMAAGAGVLVLEELDFAVERGAPILAEIVGYGATSDAHHLTAPHPEGLGARRSMTLAMKDAGVSPADIGYINAHGTSTVLNDRTETLAIRGVFGDHALRVPVSSTKSMTGHMLGAAGAVELIATVLAMRSGVVPPTINCDNPEDPELNYVANQAQDHRFRVAMSNSFGFGGHNATVVVREFPC